MKELDVRELMYGLSIHEIQEHLAEYDSGYICDVISEIADNEIDIYNSDLFEWVKYHWEYVDEACQNFGMPDCKDANITIKLIRQGQYFYNEEMLYEDLDDMLLYFCYAQLYYDFKVEIISEEQNNAIIEKCTNVDNNDKLDNFVDFLQKLIEEDGDDEEEE